MSFAASLKSLMRDTVTIAPFTSMTSAQVFSYGIPVTYRCLIERGARRTVGNDGREVVSTVQVTIPERVFIDQRSRITLPAGFVPQTPPILNVTHAKNLGLDHTVNSA